MKEEKIMSPRFRLLLALFSAALLLLLGCEPAFNSKSALSVPASPSAATVVSLHGEPAAAETKAPESSVSSSSSSAASPVTDEQAQIVLYKGPVEHLFFHPLVAFPQLAFDGDSLSKGYDDWFVTVPKFRAMLDELYNRDYILIDIHSLYQIDMTTGKAEAKPRSIQLPAGKKPLILSVDDINYYDYMRENGNVWRLVPDADGSVTAWAKTPKGEVRTSRDWELVPILDDFVKAHPDFSWNGAKGMLNLTGYAGVLGYRTNDSESPAYEKDKAAAIGMISRLKQDGWTFASHSWGHLDVQKSTLAQLKRDTERWRKEVESLTGPVDVFVYPYGSSVKSDDPKLAYLREMGFLVFCSVGPEPYLVFQRGEMFMDRRHIDGIALRTQRKRLEPLFGDLELLDPARSTLNGNPLNSP
jgi:hypothetical protein